MKHIFYLFFILLLVMGCKKYLDPKYAYEQPIFEFNIGSEKISCDSSIGILDSFTINSVKVRTTVGHFLIQNQEIVKLQIKGQSLGSYDIDSFTFVQYSPINDTMVYRSKSGKIVVWDYDSKTRKVAADVNVLLENELGKTLELTAGRFVNLGY